MFFLDAFLCALAIIGDWIASHVTVISSVVAAIATGFIAAFTVTLSKASNQLSSLAAQQLTDARIVQRAYVFVKDPHAAAAYDASGANFAGLKVWVIWRNSGTTPADPVSSLISTAFIGKGSTFSFGQATDGQPSQPFVLGPDAEITGGPVTIGVEHVNAAREGRGELFLSGKATFKDSFDRRVTHVVEYCYKIAIERVGPGQIEGTFSPHGEHNRYYDE